MGYKTRIDWCDSSWNPVTGCLHGCEYCYAKGIAHRFRGHLPAERPDTQAWVQRDADYPFASSSSMPVLELSEPQIRQREDGKIVSAPYPMGFMPTFHRYRLDIPTHWTEPRNIFVCSMADLFGAWVPGEWIKAVMDACYAAPQHRYLFLTKNPERYYDAIEYIENNEINIKGCPVIESPQIWFGASATTNDQLERAYGSPAIWISIEPILEHIETDTHFGDVGNYGFGEREFGRWKWVVIGAETGNREDKVVPKKEWVMEIVEECKEWKTPVFMKESLHGLMGPDFRQEFPWEVSIDV